MDRVRVEPNNTEGKGFWYHLTKQFGQPLGRKKDKTKNDPARLCLVVSIREFYKQTGLWIKI